MLCICSSENLKKNLTVAFNWSINVYLLYSHISLISHRRLRKNSFFLLYQTIYSSKIYIVLYQQSIPLGFTFIIETLTLFFDYSSVDFCYAHAAVINLPLHYSKKPVCNNFRNTIKITIDDHFWIVTICMFVDQLAIVNSLHAIIIFKHQKCFLFTRSKKEAQLIIQCYSLASSWTHKIIIFAFKVRYIFHFIIIIMVEKRRVCGLIFNDFADFYVVVE